MLTAFFGGKHKHLRLSTRPNRFLAVRTRDHRPAKSHSFETHPELNARAGALLDAFDPVLHFEEAGVQVFRLKKDRPLNIIATAKAALRAAPPVRFAGRVIAGTIAREPVLYTENLFIQFHRDASSSAIKRVLRRLNITAGTEKPYARNSFFVKTPEGTGQAVFSAAETLLREPVVRLCHPELIRPLRHRATFPLQWHLGPRNINGISIDAHASVEACWPISRGAEITIAIIDDGIDVTHPEFSTAGKIVYPRDVTRGVYDPTPGVGGHGTASAGVACAGGIAGAAGVAPEAFLLPVRQASGVGAMAEADAIYWAARNGADVLSCSWGPGDGNWQNPDDPAHRQVWPIPDHTWLALEWAATNGRGGRGLPVFWAAGNGNESVDNDGYASCEWVLAIGATNDQGLRAPYSDFGSAVWCCFPSSDPLSTRTKGIWTTDRPGSAGFNPGIPTRGDAAGNYVNSFGGTSSAAPGAAGVAALVLAQRPDLTLAELKKILSQTCDPIGGPAAGYTNGRSPYYGYGLLNAVRAVTLARGLAAGTLGP